MKLSPNSGSIIHTLASTTHKHYVVGLWIVELPGNVQINEKLPLLHNRYDAMPMYIFVCSVLHKLYQFINYLIN